MTALAWIILTSLVMTVIALIGSVTLLLNRAILDRVILPLVALAAGTLVGSPFLHLIPTGLQRADNHEIFFIWVLAGFVSFFALEQFLHWRHCHSNEEYRKHPFTYLILIGDGLHNYIGGFAIGGIFMTDTRLGLMAWLAAVAHEIPQELGDFGVLVHGGWDKVKALLVNMVSGITYLAGGLSAYFFAFTFDSSFLIPFAAGNFLYLGASDLVPEINRHESLKTTLLHFILFTTGILLMWAIREVLGHV